MATQLCHGHTALSGVTLPAVALPWPHSSARCDSAMATQLCHGHSPLPGVTARCGSDIALQPVALPGETVTNVTLPVVSLPAVALTGVPLPDVALLWPHNSARCGSARCGSPRCCSAMAIQLHGHCQGLVWPSTWKVPKRRLAWKILRSQKGIYEHVPNPRNQWRVTWVKWKEQRIWTLTRGRFLTIYLLNCWHLPSSCGQCEKGSLQRLNLKALSGEHSKHRKVTKKKKAPKTKAHICKTGESAFK